MGESERESIVNNVNVAGKWELTNGLIKNIDLKQNGKIYENNTEIGDWVSGKNDRLTLRINNGLAEGTYILEKMGGETLSYSGKWINPNGKSRTVEMNLLGKS